MSKISDKTCWPLKIMLKQDSMRGYSGTPIQEPTGHGVMSNLGNLSQIIM